MNLHPQLIIDSSYFAAAFLFIYGLKRMSSPVTARSGIVVAGIGMLVATLASFLYYFGVDDAARPHLPMNITLAATALIIGTAVSWWQGKRVAITAMPQMVALYNGMGGGSAAAIAAVELLRTDVQHPLVPLVVTIVGALIGSISLSGSNFVHGIVVVGAMYALLNASTLTEQIIGTLGVFLGAMNAAGGYVVTERMLEMFKPSQKNVDKKKA